MCDLIDPLIEDVNAAHVERDLGEVSRLSAQQGDDTFDRRFDIARRPRFTGLGIKLKEPAAGFDLAGLGKLHANDA